MRTRTALRWPAVLLAAAALLIQTPDADAKDNGNYGPAVDAFCLGPQGDGTSPFNGYSGTPWIDDSDRRCGLCHGPTSFKKQPEFDWHKNGAFNLFCPTAPNTPPKANDDSANTNEDAAVTIAVLSNDSDADGDALSVSSVTQGANGGAVTNNGGNVRYTPDADFNGADSFSYSVSDGKGGTHNATVNVTVNSVNDPPLALADAASTNEDAAVTIDVLTNDTDADGDRLSVSAVTQGANGATVTNNGDDVRYQPNPGFSGDDSFTYTASDGNGGTDSATVTVTVIPNGNQPPVASDDDPAGTIENTPVTIDVLANDTDPDGDPLYVSTISDGANGTVASAGDDVTYTPNRDFTGTDTFTYTANDGIEDSNVATVRVVVSAKPLVCIDTDGDDFSPEGGICGPVDSNDNEFDINPGVAELCADGIDNDSDGAIDSADSECNAANCLASLFGIANITRAEWHSAASQLELTGTRCNTGALVKVFDADTGVRLDNGNTFVDNIGAWVFKGVLSAPTKVPCRVRVDMGDHSAEGEVANAPADCGDGSRGPAEFRITKAKWLAGTQVLRVIGDGAQAAQTVTVYSANPGIAKSLGTSTVKADGSWRFRQRDPKMVPCRVQVQIDGKVAERDVAGAPQSCDEPRLRITWTKWVADKQILRVTGDGVPVGESVTVYNANPNFPEALGTATAAADGKWRFKQSQPQSVPCVVRAVIGERSDERDVKYAPQDCDDLGGEPVEVGLTKAEWAAENWRLRVEGEHATAGKTVTVYNANPGFAEALGVTTVQADGKWRFEWFNPQTLPCRVRAEIDGTSAERDVENAPSNCDDADAPPPLEPADFSIDRASWDGGDRKLMVSGSKGPRGQGEAILRSADDPSVVLGRTKVEDDGRWKFEVEKPPLVPCVVRVEIGSSAAERALSNAPGSCFE